MYFSVLFYFETPNVSREWRHSVSFRQTFLACGSFYRLDPDIGPDQGPNRLRI